MEVQVTQQSGYVLVKTIGALDETAEQHLRDLVHPLVARPGMKVILDLSQSPRINSQGVAQLVKLVADSNTHSSRVILAQPSPFVAGVFTVTRLTRFFEVVDSLPAAVERLAGKSAGEAKAQVDP